MKNFLKKFHLCWIKLNNLDKSEISSKLKHDDSAKDVKLELGQIELYILPLYLTEHEWIDSAENSTVFSTLFSLLSIRWINYLRQALWPYLYRCSKVNFRQFMQKFFTISWSCKIQPHWKCLCFFNKQVPAGDSECSTSSVISNHLYWFHVLWDLSGTFRLQ